LLKTQQQRMTSHITWPRNPHQFTFKLQEKFFEIRLMSKSSQWFKRRVWSRLLWQTIWSKTYLGL